MVELNNFDANEVEPMGDFQPMPAGEYTAEIIDTEKKPTSKGTGHYLEVTFEVKGGDFDGRKLKSFLNIDNPNDIAVRIARSELSSICRAVRVMVPKDTQELHHIPLVIRVNQEENHKGTVVNAIKGYAEKVPDTQSVQSVSSTPPWARSGSGF